MKKVIINSPVNTVNINNVSFKKYYGAKIGGTKGYITRREYNSDVFKFVAMKDCTNGNCWGSIYQADTLIKLIKQAIDLGDEVLEFDDEKELLKWLLED